jgi:hypothetical protein
MRTYDAELVEVDTPAPADIHRLEGLEQLRAILVCEAKCVEDRLLRTYMLRDELLIRRRQSSNRT